ncbi:hypothetical protein EYZ11_002658 [Aspergillus tanneri]|uniref:Retrovirus-related Pol polyprotein from transposon TNT 1-94-like beta-barrel domain-containing protein n=1 Tax=Aspergillus tanneri TaxID=1220188 RepID=A0A4S3JSC1_9EURO|nr:uncharacterized protein ATNIH1004_002297 [Aspergillus tanneri]KAA8649626.1 hypothetical protein ATNIH1004_002297 [Aspergillus tanneri]THC97858.1 hypothetical protein EYZ11_002658 [Aspergillus tanneri]
MGEIGEFWRDVKEARKRREKENPPRRRCWDWMIVSGTCHYAKNRSSFKEYRRVGQKVPNGLFKDGPETYIAGVGTVELNVRTNPKKGSRTRTLVLENVLHVPDAICNGFCFAKYHATHGGMASLDSVWKGTDKQGSPLWYGQPFRGLEKLVLAGNPQGESYLDDGPKFLSMYVDKTKLENILS